MDLQVQNELIEKFVEETEESKVLIVLQYCLD